MKKFAKLSLLLLLTSILATGCVKKKVTPSESEKESDSFVVDSEESELISEDSEPEDESEIISESETTSEEESEKESEQESEKESEKESEQESEQESESESEIIIEDGSLSISGVNDVKSWPINKYFDVFKGVTATANNGEIDVSNRVKVYGNVNYGKSGTYSLKYSLAVGDEELEVTRNVTVTGNDDDIPSIEPGEESSEEEGSEETGKPVLTFNRFYNNEYMNVSYNISPFDYNGHICNAVKVNDREAWYEDLINGSFNVRVFDINLNSYTFTFIDGNSVSYLSITIDMENGQSEEESEVPTSEVDTDIPEGVIDLGFVLVEAYGTYFIKVSYNVDPFQDEYKFSYYTVNDGELHQTWKVKDGDLYQLNIGTNKAGSYTIKFYDTDNKLYAMSTIFIANKSNLRGEINKWSYATGNIDIDHPMDPINLGEDIKDKPIPTNTWFSGMFSLAGNTGLNINQYRSRIANAGISISDTGKGGVQAYRTNIDQLTGKFDATTYSNFTPDFNDLVVKTGSLTNSVSPTVLSYSDNGMKLALRNNGVAKDELVATYSQGSPYVFFESKGIQDYIIDLRIPGVEDYRFYNLNGELLEKNKAYKGEGIIVELVNAHRGYEYKGNCPEGGTSFGAGIFKSLFYIINTPKDSSLSLMHGSHSDSTKNDRLLVKPKGNNFISIASLGDQYQNISELKNMINLFHKHGYTVSDKSNNEFTVNHETNKVTSTFRNNIRVLEDNRDDKLLYGLYPHQWKKTNANTYSFNVRSMRGEIKYVEGNYFSTIMSFYGLLPGFTLPKDAQFNRDNAAIYLNSLDTLTDDYDGEFDPEAEDNKSYDLDYNEAYWNSKCLYPMSQGLIIADQLGEETLKAKFIAKLRYVLEDWYQYEGEEDTRFFYYNAKWGALYPNRSDFGVNTRLTDHHFTYGYLVYASSVLSMYDSSFLHDYEGMIDLLVRDYMNSDRNDTRFPYLRTFDSYNGHSWSDGMGDTLDGNNQESSGEALNSWVGGYMFGLATNNQKLVDAAIYGYTSEMYAVKQYWFDYDENNWYNINIPSETGIHALAMIWGNKNEFQTWFGPSVEFIYGIQWLPTGEYLSGYALGNTERTMLNKIYNSMLSLRGGEPLTWHSNMWAIEALVNPSSAVNKFNANKILSDDYPCELVGSYWMVHALNYLGVHSNSDYMQIMNDVACSIYQNGSVKTAMVWNTSGALKTITINVGGNIVNKTVPAGFSEVTL